MATGAAIAVGAAGIAGSAYSANKADNAIDSSMDALNTGLAEMQKYFEQANIYGEDSLAFAQQMLTDWEDTFGSIEDNLSEYYQNLDPAKYAQEYKTNLSSNIDKQMKQMNESLSASGLMTSGMAAQNEKEAAFAKATGNAQADLMAEDKVASMQQGFVNTGSGRYNAATSGINRAYGNLANTSMNAGSAIGGMYGDIASGYRQSANQYASDAGGFLKGGLESLVGGLA